MTASNSIEHFTKSSVRVVLVGDALCGKTSLISTLVSEAFPRAVPSVMHPVMVPPDITPERVRFTLVDTSSKAASAEKVQHELLHCDVIILVCASNSSVSLDRVKLHWIPMLESFNVPIVIALSKIDCIDDERVSVAHRFDELVQTKKVSICIECSAKQQINVAEVFFWAQKAVIYPTAPLINIEDNSLSSRFKTALTRVFRLCDEDHDGLLNDAELDNFQKQCFYMPLKQNDIEGIKRVLSLKNTAFIDARTNATTFAGFCALHKMLIDKNKQDTAWFVLKHFGYNDKLELRGDYLTYPPKIASDQTFELTVDFGLRFLYDLFKRFDMDKDGALNKAELETVFLSSPRGIPFPEEYGEYVTTNEEGNLNASGWLAQWSLLTFFEPRSAFKSLAYLGCDPNVLSKCLRSTQRKSIDRSSGIVKRNTLHCLVFGSRACGKSALLDRFLHKTHQSTYETTKRLNTIAGLVDIDDLNDLEESKFLIMTEVPSIDSIVQETLSTDVPNADILVMMYDQSNARSFSYISRLIENNTVASCLPHIVLAFKSDRAAVEQLDEHSEPISPIDFCQRYDLSVVATGAFRVDLDTIFQNLAEAAVLPAGFRPSTPSQRRRSKYLRWTRRFVTLSVLGGALFYAGSRVYSWRSAQQTSNESVFDTINKSDVNGSSHSFTSKVPSETVLSSATIKHL